MNNAYRKNALDLEHKEHLELYRAALVIAGSSILGLIYAVYNTGSAPKLLSFGILLGILGISGMWMNLLKKKMEAIRDSIHKLG